MNLSKVLWKRNPNPLKVKVHALGSSAPAPSFPFLQVCLSASGWMPWPLSDDRAGADSVMLAPPVQPGSLSSQCLSRKWKPWRRMCPQHQERLRLNRRQKQWRNSEEDAKGVLSSCLPKCSQIKLLERTAFCIVLNIYRLIKQKSPKCELRLCVTFLAWVINLIQPHPHGLTF